MSSRNSRDPMLPHGSDKCQCPACAMFFNSTYAFDMHRTGRVGRDRRCRTADELVSLGWSRNKTGHFITRTRDAGAAIAAMEETSPPV
jgi:hypothetical protein